MAGLALATAVIAFPLDALHADGLDLSVLDTAQRVAAPMVGPATTDLQLEVFINDQPMGLIAAVRQEAEGRRSIDPVQLYNVGILPAQEAKRPDGRIDLARLPGVTVVFDDVGQRLYFTAAEDKRAPKAISARRGIDPDDRNDPRNEIQTGHGALLNYALNANGLYGFEQRDFYPSSISGNFESRLFGPAGVLENSFSLTSGAFRRLDTTWSLSDPSNLRTIRAGDLISGGLSWTRPTRLAGLQLQSDFGLRPGLITMPVPGFTGSAAVPSTVEVFLNNARRFTSDVEAGPFDVVDMPVVTGPGTARIVVRDEDGNETVTESSYFVSDRLLRPGLLDYSFEAGFPRTGFGSTEEQYDSRLFASASLRYGISDWLTWEGHAEGGQKLVNGGFGLVAGLGSFGVGSFAVSGSSTGGEQGVQVSGSVEFDLGRFHVQARAQQTFGDYNDIASVTTRDVDNDEDGQVLAGAAARSMQQVSVSAPVLDMGFLNLSYTQLETATTDRNRLLSASFGRPLFGGTFTASGFTDLERNSYGVFASLSFPIGNDMTASTTARSDSDGFGLIGTVNRPASEENGNFGWQLQYEQRNEPRIAAKGDVETPVATVGATLRQADDAVWANGRISGAVVAAGGGVFLSDRIDDAFAIVDAGVGNVTVLRENRPIGATGHNGKMLVPDLRSYERNRIGIDPTGLPLDAAINSTQQIVIPADRTGVRVTFGNRAAGGNALVTLKDENGVFIDVGSSVAVSGNPEPFVTGYDGQTYLTGLKSDNHITVQKPSGAKCDAEFQFAPDGNNLVEIADVACIQRKGNSK